MVWPSECLKMVARPKLAAGPKSRVEVRDFPHLTWTSRAARSGLALKKLSLRQSRGDSNRFPIIKLSRRDFFAAVPLVTHRKTSRA